MIRRRRIEGRTRRLRRTGLLATAIAVGTTLAGAAAQVITVGPVAVGTSNGDAAYGSLLAVSNGGTASSGQYRPLTCPITSPPPLPITGPPIGSSVSLCNLAVDGTAINTTGTADAPSGPAISAAGCAFGIAAASLTGCASGTAALALTGPASGTVAISGTSSAQGCTVAVSGNTASPGQCPGGTVVGVNNYDDEVAGEHVPAFGGGHVDVVHTESFSPLPLTGSCASDYLWVGGDGAAGAVRFGAVSAGVSYANFTLSGCDSGTAGGGSITGTASGSIYAGASSSCTVTAGSYTHTGTALDGTVWGNCTVAGGSHLFSGTLAGSIVPIPDNAAWFSQAAIGVTITFTFSS